MSDDGENLVTANAVLDFLKRKKKTRYWFHNLGARHSLLPPPIIKANHVYVNGNLKRILSERFPEKLKKLKGRTVYYPDGIIAYLGLIIKLRDVKGLSFERIAKDETVVRELKKLNYLVNTSLFVNPLQRDGGFVTNFRVARRILIERYGIGRDGVLKEVLDLIAEEAKINYSKYFKINEEIRGQALRSEVVDKDLEKKKKMLSYSVSLSLKIMEAVTKTALEGVRKKEISQLEWFNVVEELQNKDQKAGINK